MAIVWLRRRFSWLQSSHICSSICRTAERLSFLRIAEKRLLTESKLMALAVHVVQLFYNNNFKVILTNPPVSLSFKQSSSWTLYSSKGSEGGVRQNVISIISILWLNDEFFFNIFCKVQSRTSNFFKLHTIKDYNRNFNCWKITIGTSNVKSRTVSRIQALTIFEFQVSWLLRSKNISASSKNSSIYEYC